MFRGLRALCLPAVLAGVAIPFVSAFAADTPPIPVPPPPVEEVIEGTLERDPIDVYEFDAGIGEDTTAAEVCQMFAETIDGTRHPVSEVVHMKKQPKVGDKVKIDWKTPKVTIKIEGKVTAINQDGLATVNVTKITGEYKDVVAGLELNQDWSVFMDWP